MSLHIPAGFGSVAMVHEELGISELGTEPYIWTFGIEQEIGDISVDTCNDIFDAWVAELAGDTATDINLVRVDITVPAVGGGTGVISSTNVAENGTLSIDPIFSNMAPKVRKLTALPGRRYRGVLHPVGMLDVANVSGAGIIESSRRASIEAAFTEFFAAVGGAGYFPNLLHSDPAIAPTPLTGITVAAKVGLLRNRLL